MKKVLIVESDEQEAQYAAMLVNQSGYDVTIYNQNELLPIVLIDLDPDIVIIYRKLFLKNRQLFISQRQERLSKAFLIVTSGAFLTKERVKELGADQYLHKPYHAIDIEAMLGNYELDKDRIRLKMSGDVE